MSGIHCKSCGNCHRQEPGLIVILHCVTEGLHRYYGTGDLHFITWSCHRRQPILGTAPRRDLLVTILEQARRKYRFVVHGYVVMPEHVHLLITEPEEGDPSVVMKVVKQRFARQLNEKRRATAARRGQLWESALGAVWQKRFYDFSVWTERKRSEKLRYMHRNPVKRGLVAQPDQWEWSSFRAYFLGERGLVRVNFQEWASEIKCRTPQGLEAVESTLTHSSAKNANEWGTRQLGVAEPKSD
jgi:putative transposase